MKIILKKIIVTTAAIILALIVSPSAFAGDEDRFPKDNHHPRFEFRFGEDEHFNQGGQEFEIDGIISSISGNSFVLSGQTILIDPSQVREFEQKGVLAVGQRVKVEGIVKNGMNFAQEINVIGTGQGRFQFKVEEKPAGVGVTATPSLAVKVQTQGAVQEVSSFLQQVLNFLKSFVS